MPRPPRFTLFGAATSWLRALLVPLGLGLAACPSQPRQVPGATPPPVGHYEGSITRAGQPAVRAALDIRHPSPGHYEAELTVPTAGGLSFVADTIFFTDKKLRLVRPGRPGQLLTLALEGDFWRGTLGLDSLRAETLLVKRGPPTPSTYRVEELPRPNGSAWLYAPADTGTPGTAVALLPSGATAAAAPLWADALAREGVIVLVLPAADSGAAGGQGLALAAALRLLRHTPGADSANVGVWVEGPLAAAVAQALAAAGGPQPAFFVAQNAAPDLAAKVAFRELRSRELPVLGLYGGPNAPRQAAALRNALGGGPHGSTVRVYHTAGADLLVPGTLGPSIGADLPPAVAQWLQSR